ncbi:hypothetical protein Dimus_014717 [Dionaea muscipula]
MGSQLKTKQIISTSAAIKTRQIAGSSKLIALGFLESLLGLAYICAKQTGRAKRKVRAACAKRLVKYKALRNGEDDGALWQRTILMGDRCQPLDFSGVIYSATAGAREGDDRGRKLTTGLPANPQAGDRQGRLYLLQ